MKNKSKSRSAAVPRVDPYIDGLMAKLLERLVSLEKKMDTVIDQLKPIQSPEAKQPSRRDRVLYEAICADCHKVCEVPFKPSEDRAVYCKECFARRKSGGATGKTYPVLTPVVMPSKIINKPHAAEQAALTVPDTPKKVKKGQAAKKAKKKK
jgi:CxxC-x17-CxxC domain-containing protein